jgi:hypothetical protein
MKRVAAIIAAIALLTAGYAAAGPAGLLDMGAVVAIAALLLVRVRVRGGEPHVVMTEKEVTDAGFPGFGSLVSEMEWAMLSRRHYERSTRPRLERLAVTLGRTLPGEAYTDEEGTGPSPDELGRLIDRLEER